MQNSVAKKIFAVGSAAAMTLALGAPFAAFAAPHSDGTNVLDSSGTVWMITGGQRRAYTSAGAFLSYGFNSWASVVSASADDLALPAGSFIPPQDGAVFCATETKGSDVKGECSLVTGGTKAAFTSAAVFTGLGFSFARAQYGDSSFLSKSANVDNTTAAHRTGVLVNNNGTVQLMGASGLLGIPDVATFNSWGYSFANVVPANAADKAMTQTGVMVARLPGQLSPSWNVTPPPGPQAGGSVSVSLAANNPPAGSVAKSAKVVFTRFVFTGGSSGATINTLILHRLGLSSDSDVSNVYLYNDGTNALLGTASMNQGVLTLTGSPLLSVPANSSVTVSVRADMNTSSNATTGDTIGYGISSAADIQGVNVSGNFPVNGNQFTIAAVTNLGALIITSPSTLASTVNPGTQQTNVGYFSFAGSNQPLSITYLKFTNIGSITNGTSGNVQNLKLYNNATQVGTVQQLNTDGTVVFDLSASPMVIPSGQTSQVWLKGDIMGGSNRTFQFTIQRSTDVWANDTTYNTGIVPGLATATGTSPVPTGTVNQVTINAGSAVMAVDTMSPTGNIAIGANAVPFSTFDFTAAGEDVRISALTISATTTTVFSDTGGTASDSFTNGKLCADATITNGVLTNCGTQVGSTFSLAVDSLGAAVKTTALTIPGYWTIPAGTTHKLTIVADTKLTTATALTAGAFHADITSVTAQGASSLSTVSFGTATGRTLTMVSGSLTASLNSALANGTSANPTGVGGQTGVKVGSFVLTAGAAEGINITLISVTASSVAATYLQNMKVMVNNSQVGTTQGVLANSTAYNFSPNAAINVPAGGAITIDVLADLISGVTSASVPRIVALTGVTSTGAVDNTAITLTNATTDGQTIYVATSGSLNTTLDSAAPTTAMLQQVPMGALKQTLAVFNFSSTSTAEAVQIQKLVITDTETSGKQGDLLNCGLYPVGGSYGTSVSATPFIQLSGGEGGSGTTGTLTYNMQTIPLVVPASGSGSSVSVYLKCDVSTYANAASGDTHLFNIALASDITAIGAMSGASISSNGSFAVSANTATLYRSTLSITLPNSASTPYTSTPSGASSASATQNVAIFNLTNYANAASQQVTFLPTAAEAGSGGKIIDFTFNSTINVSTSNTARIFKLFKATDLSTAILAATITPAATNSTSTWSGTLEFKYTGTTADATWTTSGANVWTGAVSATTITPQLLNAGATQQYVAQFDTTDAVAQKTFTLSLGTQTSTFNVWYDGSATSSTLMTLPVTFGTLTY